MRTMTPNTIPQPAPQPPPAPIEWSSDHTARTVTRIAADVATIRRWVTFAGIVLIIWVCLMGIVLLTTVGALSNATN